MMQTTPASFRRSDYILIGITWLTYMSFYLGRLNISPALPVIATDLGIGLGRAGLLGTVFFMSYAVGQIIMGQIGNIVNPRLIVFAGLLLIGVSNIVFSRQEALPVLAIVWAVNGFAQAMGWGPILRILSSHLTPEKISRISSFFAISFQIGTAIAWGLAGFLVANSGWQSAFLIPGLILLVVAGCWLISGVNAGDDSGTIRSFHISDMADDVRGLLPLLIAAACMGFIYIGILLWLPTLMRDWQFIPSTLSNLTTALVPLVGISGMVIAGALLAHRNNVKQTILFFLFALLASLTLSFLTTDIFQGVFILLTVVVISGLAGLILSSAPLLLSAKARVSSAGGLVTAVWSVAGGLSGTIIGSMVETSGWSSVMLMWVGLTIVAIFSLLAISNVNPQKKEQSK